MDYQALLNERQFEAVSTEAKHVRIIAGAGSGKTRVLTFRIAYLVSERNVNPSNILAITFTNKVANEMKDRAEKLVPSAKGKFKISTFHSFCASFLRREIDAINYPRDFMIIDDEDQTKMVKDILAADGYKRKDPIVKDVLNTISHYKCIGQYPEDVVIKNDYRKAELTRLIKYYQMYEDKKNSMGMLDFDDLLLKAIEVLEKDEYIAEKWRNRYSNILIDEFQDTNDVQYKLLKLLTKEDTSVYVVGDPDQTIYTWRGANQDIILHLDRLFPDMVTIVLDRNYRSTKIILDTANKLISHNRMRVPKDLYTENPDGEKIEINMANKASDEAEWVVNKITKLDNSGDYGYRKTAILYRSSYLTLPFETALAKYQIPYRLFGGVRFYQRKEIKDVIAYIRLLLNSKDDISFQRIINVPKRGIGDSSLSILLGEAENNKLSILNYIQSDYFKDSGLPNRVVSALTNLSEKINSTLKRLQENLEAISEVVREFIVDVGYFEYIKSNEEEEEDRLENVQTLFQDMTAFFKNNTESSLEAYIEQVTLASAQDDINSGNYVSLMTIHTAKGLEFDNVFVVGMNEGVFPSPRSLDEGYIRLEEERRLCYVAFTRAKQRLFLSGNGEYSFITQARKIPSRFFNESELQLHRKEYIEKKQKEYIFGDGDAISPFNEDAVVVPKPVEVSNNGITDWSKGDIVFHKVFGKGIVTDVIDETIIEVNFDTHGVKKLLGTHPAITRLTKTGRYQA